MRWKKLGCMVHAEIFLPQIKKKRYDEFKNRKSSQQQFFFQSE